MTKDSQITDSPTKKTARRWPRQAAQALILGLVAWGIYGTIRQSTVELGEKREELMRRATEMREKSEAAVAMADRAALRAEAIELEATAHNFWKARPLGLLLAGLLYALGMLPSCAYWHRCLAALGQQTPFLPTAWAYFWGNLGKYFPGKAMVLILRVAALKKFDVHKTATSITIFMETLTMMAVGGAVGAGCTLILNIDWRLTALAVGLLAVTFIPTYPPVLKRLIPKLQRGVAEADLDRWTARVTWRLTATGWLMLAVTWFLFGLSLLAVLLSLPATTLTSASALTLFLSTLGACALAVVLGFVSLIPGGAGVREALLSIVLSPVVGPTAAICCAIWMRFVWLATELSVVGLTALARWLGTKRETAP